MTIIVSSDIEAQPRRRAKAEGVSMDAYIERLIRDDDEWADAAEEPAGERDPEFAEVRVAVTEGLEQARRGEGRAAEEVFTELRAKYGISS